MTARIGTFSIFSRVLRGILFNQVRSVRAQEQLASGQRILRPSDDPVGAARVLRFDRRLAEVGRFRAAINTGRNVVDTAASALQDASGLLAEARELLIQGMNGTLSQEDRNSVASQFEGLRDQLISLANTRSGERYLFGGTKTGTEPFVEVTGGARARVEYRGNSATQSVRAGQGLDVSVTMDGLEAFGRFQFAGTRFEGRIGASSGTTADQGTGYAQLLARHDATDPGNLGYIGIVLVNGGDDDTLLGTNTLTIDPVAGTIQLGTGPVVTLPAPTDPEYAALVVTNELGGQVNLDLTTWDGSAFADDVVGNGSISLDGSTFTPLTFTETDLELRDDASGTILHVDTTGIRTSGAEVVTFAGTTNVFDLMQGIAEDLRNADGLESGGVLNRLSQRLTELDRNHENLLVSAGTLGSRSRRLSVSEDHAEDLGIQLLDIRSRVGDADLAEVAVELARLDIVLQASQASGARLMQTSLLNFLR